MITVDDFKHIFIKRCDNMFSCSHVNSKGVRRYQWYNNDDLNRLSREAFDRGETVFYANKLPQKSHLHRVHYELAEPQYTYRPIHAITEKQYNDLLEIVTKYENEQKEKTEVLES